MATDAKGTDLTAMQTGEAEPEDPFVPVFRSSNHDAEMEAMAIKGILDANGIPAILIGPHVLPLEFQIQVPESRLAEARSRIAEAQAAGPQAAEEAEAATEGRAAPES
jgi:hypothetical protein